MWSGNNGSIHTSDRLLVPHLFSSQNEVIDDNMFSFYLTGHADDSYIDFGKYDKHAITNENDIVWLEVLDNDRWWTNYITGFKWGYSNPMLYSFEQTKAFTDTGTSCIIGPKDYVDWILSTLTDQLTSA